MSSDTPIIGGKALGSVGRGINDFAIGVGKGLDYNGQAYGELAKGNVGGFFSRGEKALKTWGKAVGLDTGIDQGDPVSLGAPPSQAQAADGAISGVLNRENQLRSASTVLTGGAGLLDDEPETFSASRSLSGR